MKMIIAIVCIVCTALTTQTCLAATMSYTCNFPLFADLVGLQKPSKKFELRFVSDQVTHTSYMLGNNGSVVVKEIINQGGGVSFVEITEFGNVMITAITTSGKAVHSRNTIVHGELVPSQYYGTCLIQ